MKQTFNHRWLLIIVGLMVSIISHAQTLVKGTVVDTNGEPIIGASVLEKGTSNGTVSDIDGHFKLNVKAGKIIVVSYLGYKTQEKPAAATMTFRMAENNELLDEVVVVGYGVQKKSDLTGAIAKVESEDLQNRTVLSAEQALAGKTSGVQLVSSSAAPGSTSSVRIRGYSSNYSSDPLYIVDGMKVPDMNSIDPNDIESVEVLKDAASAAIYGAEAGNGVILITTKKAKKGDGKIEYNFQFSSQSVARTPDVLNPQEYIQYQKEGGFLTDALIKQYYDPNVSTNWIDVAFEKSTMMKHQLSFTQGGDKTNLYISANYQTNNGIIAGDDDKSTRVGLDLSVDSQIKSWLKVGLNANGSYTTVDGVNATQTGGNGVVSAMLKMDPTVAVTYPENALPEWMQIDKANGYPLVKAPNGDYYGYSYFFRSSNTNPLLLRDIQHTYTKRSFIRSMAYVNITPFKGFVFTSRVGANLFNNYSRQYQRAYYVSYNSRQDTPMVTVNSPYYTHLLFENFANYNTTFGQDHNLSATLGMSYSDNRSNSLSGSVNNITRDDPNFAYLDFKTADATQTVSGIDNNTRKLSYFGRVGYNYAQRYYVEATMRADAADLSYISEKKRWGYFPAASVGWVPSNEKWFKKNKVIDFLKVRASWGQNGSLSSLGSYAYASSILMNAIYAMNNQGATAGATPSALGNPDLKWETSEQTDFGIDMRFFNSRLTLTADYFIKKTKDLIITGVNPSLTAGNTPSPTNAGDIENRGFELDLGWRDHIGDFQYGIKANMATLRNRVTYLDPSIMRIDGVTVNRLDGFTAFEKGQPIWYFRGYKFDHINPETGEAVMKDLNGDKIINTEDRTNIGSGIPSITYGITLTAAYKGFDLLVFGSGAAGQEIFANYNKLEDRGANRLKLYYDNRWTPENTNTNMIRPGAISEPEFLNSDAQVFDGSYFKIKQIQLGYTLPKNLVHKTKLLENLRVYLSLDDFFLFTDYPGMDPETASGNTTTWNGIDSGQYPLSKKVTLGLNITF